MRRDRCAALPPESSLMTRRPKKRRVPVDRTRKHSRRILAAAATANIAHTPGKFDLALPVPDGCPTVCVCILLQQRACTDTHASNPARGTNLRFSSSNSELSLKQSGSDPAHSMGNNSNSHWRIWGDTTYPQSSSPLKPPATGRTVLSRYPRGTAPPSGRSNPAPLGRPTPAPSSPTSTSACPRLVR